jgi:hypothetical protein
MSDEQLTRFEFFVRSHLPRNHVKELITNAIGPSYTITDDMAIVVGSLAKLFIGELTEIGLLHTSCLLLVFFSSFSKFFEMFVCPSFLPSATHGPWVPIAIDVMKERQTGDGLTVEYIEYVLYC